MSRLRALARCGRGTAAVEFAIIAAVLIALVVGTIDFGRTYYVKNHLSHLADKAARTLMMKPDISQAELDKLEADLREAFTAGASTDLTIDFPEASAGGMNYREVTIGFPVSLFVPGLDSGTVALSVTRRVPTR